MKRTYDVIVIGGGAIGLSAANEAGKRKSSVLVLERFSFLNQRGSSAGISRQYRVPYPDKYMVQMALDTMPYWDKLQESTPKPLMDKVGTLWFGDPNVHSTEGNIGQAKLAMDSLGVKYDTLTSAQVEEKYRFKGLPDNYTGIFQKDGASIDLALTLKTMLELNIAHPTVHLEENAPVTRIQEKNKIFYVTTPKGTYQAAKVVITPGPYINDVLNLLKFDIKVTYWEMSSAYFKKVDPKIQYPTWFVFQNNIGDNGNQFYGFPEVEWDHPGYIRVAPDFVIKELANPSQRTGIPNKQELEYTTEWVKNHMTGLEPIPLYTSTCLIALSKIKDKELVLDFAPPYVHNHENIVIYGTGWAAKFIPLLGSIIADMAIDGKTDYNIRPFELGYKYFKSLI
ncbi:FAD-dependent oxidoreductase [Mucilaginibacter lutimaris]|uniref:FAD-dependent oxidoreductase n=1 Tax=Mucilaginibacter lutimaris TaxID=931629 RepID=A0ABW2ZKW8_9SPHI